MEYRYLGRTGLQVSRICLGTNMMGGYVDQHGCDTVLAACLEQGINFVDTADIYNGGRSEESVGRAMQGRRGDFILMTKVGAPVGPGVNDRGSSRLHVLDGVEKSLRRLGTDYIDVYLVHRWDPATPLEETLRVMDDLVRQGKVRYIGCSNFAAWQLCKALWISDKLGVERFEVVQPPYNLRNRAIEGELLPLCADLRVGVVPYQALLGGLLSGTYEMTQAPPSGTHMASAHTQVARAQYWNPESFALVDQLRGLARQAGCTTAQLAIAWALANPAVTSVVVGASTPQQVAENARAVDVELAAQQKDALNAL